MLDRSTAPLFKKSLTYDLISPEKIVLDNGSSLLFINGGDQNVVKIECIFNAGKWYEPSPGVSYFTANLLNKGTRDKTSVQITNEFDQLGMYVEISPGYDFTSISLYGLSKNIPSIIDLFSQILTEATLPEDELLLLKNIYIQNLKVNLEKTSYLASKELRNQLFGSEHPYGNDVSIDQVNLLNTLTLKDFFSSHFSSPTIIVSGKFDHQLENLVIQMASTFKGRSNNELRFSHQTNYNSVRKEKQGSLQASIRIGKFSLSRTHKDYPALLLTNHILGGYFGSRLMKNIREEKGLTYGIYSSLTALKHSSFITIGADVNKENTELTIEEIKKEIVNLQSEKISTTELQTAINHFTGSLQSELSTPFAHADKAKTITLFSLPKNYYANLIEQVAQLTSDRIQEIAANQFRTDQLTTIAVG